MLALLVPGVLMGGSSAVAPVPFIQIPAVGHTAMSIPAVGYTALSIPAVGGSSSTSC